MPSVRIRRRPRKAARALGDCANNRALGERHRADFALLDVRASAAHVCSSWLSDAVDERRRLRYTASAGSPGGTGTYTGARGWMDLRSRNKKGTEYDFVFHLS